MRYMAIDQYGNTYHNLEHPRKDLMQRLGYRSAKKTYIDTKDGNSFHTGYVVGPHWCNVYKVEPMRNTVR